MHSNLPTRQKSQRLLNRIKADQPYQYFLQFKLQSHTVSNANELLPGLNDISDAFEAMPMDLAKYFTMLREIDAKCINTIPEINKQIAEYIDELHQPAGAPTREANIERLLDIRKHVHEVIPCLEEKMHLTSVAADILAKHMYRINNDYKVIIGNNEIPESVRIGPLNHRAMILDPLAPLDASKSAQLQRSESRREALAARKAHKDGDEMDPKKRRIKETTPFESANGNSSGSNGKRRRRENEKVVVPLNADKKRTGASKPKREKEDEAGMRSGPSGSEPTYCYCNQVSFGEMVGCDGDTCKREWFHLPCIGFKNPPKGKWYCDDCLAKMKKAKRV